MFNLFSERTRPSCDHLAGAGPILRHVLRSGNGDGFRPVHSVRRAAVGAAPGPLLDTIDNSLIISLKNDLVG